MSFSLDLSLAAALLCGIAGAQSSTPESKLGAPVSIATWRVPIHSAPGDPDGGAYGIWGGGYSFKVSFHDGFTFYPYLGASCPENLPLAWRRAEVRAGGELLIAAGAPAETRREAWRYEYRRGPLVEAYDVLEGGVEQSFTLLEKPPCGGDLVIAAQLATPLFAEPMVARHAPLVFCDAGGTERVRYGEAWALDAAGRRCAMTTSYDGARIELRLDGGWLEAASYPVVVDPLVHATWMINGSYSEPATAPDIGHDSESSDLLVTWSRYFSGSDLDGYAMIQDDTFGANLALVLTDITTAWSTSSLRVAFVGGADSWVIALQRSFPSTGHSRVRVYLHDRGSRAANSGTTIFLNGTPGTDQIRPDVGGTVGGTGGSKALVVYQEAADVFGVLVDANAATAGAPVQLDASGLIHDAEWPSVNQVSNGFSASWIAVWQEFNFVIGGDDWDVVAACVDSAGALAGRRTFGPGGTRSLHALRPSVEGRGGRYLVSYVVRSNTGSTASAWGYELRAQRFDWPDSSSSTTHVGPQRTIASDTLNSLTTGGTMGYDNYTRSHWAVTYYTAAQDVYVARVGYSGAAVERVTVEHTRAHGGMPAACFRPSGQDFPLVWVVDDSSRSPRYLVNGTRLEYFSGAANQFYGAACTGTVTVDRPYAGSEFFHIDLRAALAQAPTVLMLGLGPAALPLGGGCDLNLDPALPLIAIWSGISDRGGEVYCTFPLPDEPLIVGDLYLQFLQLHPSGALHSSSGIMTQVR